MSLHVPVITASDTPSAALPPAEPRIRLWATNPDDEQSPIHILADGIEFVSPCPGGTYTASVDSRTAFINSFTGGDVTRWAVRVDDQMPNGGGMMTYARKQFPGNPAQEANHLDREDAFLFAAKQLNLLAQIANG